jgi:hypothetical protein
MTARILWLTFAALATLAYGLPGAVAALTVAAAWHLYHRKATRRA